MRQLNDQILFVASNVRSKCLIVQVLLNFKLATINVSRLFCVLCAGSNPTLRHNRIHSGKQVEFIYSFRNFHPIQNFGNRFLVYTAVRFRLKTHSLHFQTMHFLLSFTLKRQKMVSAFSKVSIFSRSHWRETIRYQNDFQNVPLLKVFPKHECFQSFQWTMIKKPI